jgi:hypothetical protein
MMYEVNDPPTNAPIFTNYGWNVLQSYSLKTNSDINYFLRVALTNNASGTVFIPDSLDTNGNAVAWPQSQVQAWIQGSTNNANLAWWYLPEEMRWWVSSESNLLSNYAAWTRLYDPPQRPACEYTPNNRNAQDISYTAPAVDVLGISCYCEEPGIQMPHAWVRYKLQDAGVEGVALAGETLGSNYLSGQKTLLGVLYCATNSTETVATPQECYHDVWSAIASGARGIAVYAYWHAINDTPPLTNNLQQYNLAASQLAGTEQIGQVILYGASNSNVTFAVTSGPTNTVTFNPPNLTSATLPPTLASTNVSYPSLNVLSKTWGNRIYVITVNSTSNSVTAMITNLPTDSGTALLPFETNSVTVAHGGFSAVFAPWGVHIYKITPSAPTITSATASGGKVCLIFPGLANFSYVLQRSTNLSGGQGWVNVSSNTASASGPFSFTNNASVNAAYYRLQVP